MISEQEIEHHFIGRFAETHGAAPDGFIAALWKRIDKDVTIAHIELASETVIRTKRAKTFPSFAECLQAIHAARNKVANAPAKSVQTDLERIDPRWSEEASLNFCRCQIGRQAARDGWIGQLVDFVRTEKRLPIDVEIRQLQLAHKEFEKAIILTMGDSLARQWRGAGEALMKRNARYEDFVLGTGAERQASGVAA